MCKGNKLRKKIIIWIGFGLLPLGLLCWKIWDADSLKLYHCWHPKLKPFQQPKPGQELSLGVRPHPFLSPQVECWWAIEHISQPSEISPCGQVWLKQGYEKSIKAQAPWLTSLVKLYTLFNGDWRKFSTVGWSIPDIYKYKDWCWTYTSKHSWAGLDPVNGKQFYPGHRVLQMWGN